MILLTVYMVTSYTDIRKGEFYLGLFLWGYGAYIYVAPKYDDITGRVLFYVLYPDYLCIIIDVYNS